MRAERLDLRITLEERAAWLAAADAQSETLSEWLRRAARERLKREKRAEK